MESNTLPKFVDIPSPLKLDKRNGAILLSNKNELKEIFFSVNLSMICCIPDFIEFIEGVL